MAGYVLCEPRAQKQLTSPPYHRWPTDGGPEFALFYRNPEGYLIRFVGLADFNVTADGMSAVCTPALSVSDDTIEHLYLNQVLPLLLNQQGKYVFHGSAVEIFGGAISFLGASGRGKSTLAANFSLNGHRFLTDDGMVLQPEDMRQMVQPSHPSVRLWQDSRDELLTTKVQEAPVVCFTTKGRFLAGSELTHCNEPRPLLRAYFLGEGDVEEVCIRQLNPMDSLLAWMKHSFMLDVEDTSMLARHFEYVARLANHIPAFTLDFPRRFSDLNRLRATIIDHVAMKGRAA